MRLCTAQVRDIMKRVRMQFPGADVLASTFDAFVLPLANAVRSGLKLPVVTQEVRLMFPDAVGDIQAYVQSVALCKPTQASICLSTCWPASCRSCCLHCCRLATHGSTA